MTNKETDVRSAKVEAVYQSQGQQLWAILYARCCDRDLASDALQEAFLRLHEQNGTPIRDVRAWLLRVAQNWLRDVARRQRVAARPVEYLDYIAGPGHEPLSLIENKERHSQVREGLAQLKIEDREVLVLRYALSWSSHRIADVLNTTSTAVDMRLSRARRRLAELLGKMSVDYEYVQS